MFLLPYFKKKLWELKVGYFFFPYKDLGELLNPNVVPGPSTTGRVLLAYWTSSASDYVSPLWR